MVLTVGEHVFVSICDTDKINKVKSGYGYITKINADDTYHVHFTVDNCLSKHIHVSRIKVTCIPMDS